MFSVLASDSPSDYLFVQEEAIEEGKRFLQKYSISRHSVFLNRKYVDTVQQTDSGINVFIDAELVKKMEEKEKEENDSSGSDD